MGWRKIVSNMDLRLKFNEDAYNYDKFRPSYPEELFSDIINYSDISLNSEALEIGAGTGQATVPVLESGCDVTAVELGENLTRFIRNKLRSYKNFNVINADFMEYPIKAEVFNLVYCATAFHWLPQKEAFIKIKNILQHRGTIALFWNHPFPNREDDISNIASRKVYDKYRPTNKKMAEFSENDCQNYISALKAFGFKDINCKLYHRKRTLTTDEYISLLNTYSDHRALPVEIKSSFEADMRIAINGAGGKINIYDTIDLYLARKP